jgi:hypothetical protein
MAVYLYSYFGGGGVHHIHRLATVFIEFYFLINFVTRVVTHKKVPLAPPETPLGPGYRG